MEKEKIKETIKKSFWKTYVEWLKGRTKFVPNFFNKEGTKRFWILLFLLCAIVGPSNFEQNPLSLLTMSFNLFGVSLAYYTWQKRIADKKRVNINEIKSNFLAMIIILVIYAVLAYFLFKISSQLPK